MTGEHDKMKRVTEGTEKAQSSQRNKNDSLARRGTEPQSLAQTPSVPPPLRSLRLCVTQFFSRNRAIKVAGARPLRPLCCSVVSVTPLWSLCPTLVFLVAAEGRLSGR